MKILWLSDSPTAPSGFGNVTRFVCEGLVQLGHEVHILGWQTSGPSRSWKGATLHGIGWHPMGADVLLGYLYRLRPDYLITLADVWWLTFLTDPSLEQFFRMTSTRWVLYFPIDGHRPDGTLPTSWIEMLRRADVPVAMSRYGQEVVNACGVPCEYIPHGVETSTFRPAPDAIEAKRRFGYEGHFVVLSDARNQPRKMLPRLLTVFERFSRDKTDVVLHLHCDPRDPAMRESRYSYCIDADVCALGIEPSVRFTRGFTIKDGIPLGDLVALYQAVDVHLLTSTGEGFGLPTLQAASCGVVPLAPAYTANLELVGGHGSMIKVAEFVPDEFGIGRAFVDIEDTVKHLEEFYRDRELLRDWSRRSRAFAEPYDWSRVIPLWDSLLKQSVGLETSPSRLSSPNHVETLSIGDQPLSMVDNHPANVPRWPASGANRLDRTDNTSLGATVRNSFATVPVGVNITLKVSEHRFGNLARQVLDDARGDPGSPRLRIPIARTERDKDRRARERASGLVYLGRPCSERDVERLSVGLYLALLNIFPVLQCWPPIKDDIRLDTGIEYNSLTPEESDSKLLQSLMLANSILAIDLDGQDEELPMWTAYFGVPTIGLVENRWQRLFWPELCMETPAIPAVLRRARGVLTDYVATATMTHHALDAFNRHAPPWAVQEAQCLDALVTQRQLTTVQTAALSL